MTREEFDGWATEHYAELKEVARKKYGAQDCEDILHNALLSLLESQMLKVMPLTLAWPWAVSQMRGRASDWHVSKSRQAAKKKEHAASIKGEKGTKTWGKAGEDGETYGGKQPLGRPALQGRYREYSKEELYGLPLGAHWHRWIGRCPCCGGESTMVRVVDKQPNGTTGRDGEMSSRWAVVCINGHRSYDRGKRAGYPKREDRTRRDR